MLTQPVTELPLPEGEILDIRQFTQSGLTRLGMLETDEPADIVRALRAHLDDHRADAQALDHEGNAFAAFVLDLGHVWGAQVVRAYGWHWAGLLIGGEDGGKNVVHPDGRVYVNPVALVYDIVVTPDSGNNTALLFNMLDPDVLAAQLRGAGPGAYQGLH